MNAAPARTLEDETQAIRHLHSDRSDRSNFYYLSGTGERDAAMQVGNAAGAGWVSGWMNC